MPRTKSMILYLQNNTVTYEIWSATGGSIPVTLPSSYYVIEFAGYSLNTTKVFLDFPDVARINYTLVDAHVYLIPNWYVNFVNAVNNIISYDGAIAYYDINAIKSIYGIIDAVVPPSTPLSTLNGNGCEFMDGKSVTVNGRSTIYSVVRSYMGLVSDNSYTTFYDLSATTGEKLTVPEALLTLYVAPIVTP